MIRALSLPLLTLLLLAASSAHAFDPVTEDPVVTDKAHPPSSAELKIPIAGTRVNGLL